MSPMFPSSCYSEQRSWSTATVVIEHRSPASASYDSFMSELRRVFDHRVWRREAEIRPLTFVQGSALVVDYPIQFCICWRVGGMTWHLGQHS
ncbi:hypothetical protein D4764_0091910 [Takifugu flavidus]|uniref:Uncharacterized protein n=1 Tax=Takifugu flavidus TaxID=433684 RepID=A0A5C6MH22_9TELE|nr:hypothetical protein D4764_0091910 [Takifugu flavidus]